MVSPQEWQEWIKNPTTQEWFKFLTALREEIKEEWSSGVYVGAVGEETLQRNASAIGQVDLLKRLQEATVEEMTETTYGD